MIFVKTGRATAPAFDIAREHRRAEDQSPSFSPLSPVRPLENHAPTPERVQQQQQQFSQPRARIPQHPDSRRKFVSAARSPLLSSPSGINPLAITSRAQQRGNATNRFALYVLAGVTRSPFFPVKTDDVGRLGARGSFFLTRFSTRFAI